MPMGMEVSLNQNIPANQHNPVLSRTLLTVSNAPWRQNIYPIPGTAPSLENPYAVRGR